MTMLLITVALATEITAKDGTKSLKADKALGTFTMPGNESFTLGKSGGAMDFAWESLPLPMWPKVLVCGRNEKVENSYSGAKNPAEVRECATNAIAALMRGSWNMDRGRKGGADSLMRPYLDAVIAGKVRKTFVGWAPATKTLTADSPAAVAFDAYRKAHPAFLKADNGSVATAMVASWRADETNRKNAHADYVRAMERDGDPVDPAAADWV